MLKLIKSNTYFLLIIFTFSVFIRIIFLSFVNDDFSTFSDQHEYRTISNYILNGDFFTFHFLHRTPLYPLFIASIRYLEDNYFFVLIVQNFIGIFLIYLSYLISYLHFEKYYKIITVLMAFNLNILLHNNLLLTETIFLLFFLIFFLNLLNYIKFKEIKYVIYLSIFLGLSALTRPVTIYLPFFIIIIIFLNKYNVKNFLYHSFLMLFIFQIIIGLWQIRNYKLHKNFNLVTNKEVNLVEYYLPSFDQYEKNYSLVDAKKERKKNYQKYLEKNFSLKIEEQENKFARDKIAVEYSKNVFKNYEYSTLINGFFWGSFKNIFTPSFADLAYWFKLKDISFSKTDGNSFIKQSINFMLENRGSLYFYLLFVSIIITLLLRAIGLYGLYFTFKEKRKETITILIIIAYFLIIMGPIGHAKYRIPIELFLNIFVAIGLKNLWGKLKRV
jgi:hypothetical protein